PLGARAPAESHATPVKVIRPKSDPAFVVAVRELASVEAYYHAGLRTRVSGPVRWVAKDINDPVRRGELLVEIDVPDLEQEVLQKEAAVRERMQEWRL